MTEHRERQDQEDHESQDRVVRHRAGVASDEVYVLGEGPFWDPVRNRVLWVDINAHQVLTGELHGDRVIETGRLGLPGTVGAVVSSPTGELLVAGPRGLVVLPETAALTSGTRTIDPGPDLITLIPAEKPSRLNDGGCDPAGRFLIGSIALDDRQDDEQLLRIDPFGTVTVIDDHVGLSNGLAWSPDGAWFYSIDTNPGLIWIRAYHSDSGLVGERRVFLKITDGYPDGMCVDSEGNLWVAIWGAGEVRCFSPHAELLARVEVAAPNTSCVAFVGPQLDTLLITTASEQLSRAQLARYPDSGKLFTASVGSTGLPVPYWSGV